MDEYLDDDKKWIPVDHPLSFHGFMERTVYTKIKPELIMPEEQRVFPDPENVGYIPELIEKLGGVDIAFGGIGINGHVAFNEADPSLSPEEFLAQKTRVLTITPETRTANAIGDFGGALEDAPHGLRGTVHRFPGELIAEPSGYYADTDGLRGGADGLRETKTD